MGLTYTIDQDRNLITIAGDYGDADEWLRVLARILADPRRRPDCLILRDQRGGTTPVSVATVVAIMEVVRRFWRELGVRRAAILMPRDFDAPALAAQALADEDMLVQAFVSYDVAMDWLME